AARRPKQAWVAPYSKPAYVTLRCDGNPASSLLADALATRICQHHAPFLLVLGAICRPVHYVYRLRLLAEVHPCSPRIRTSRSPFARDFLNLAYVTGGPSVYLFSSPG